MIHLGKITADATAILAMTVTAGTDVTAMTVTAGTDVTAMTVTAGADVTAMTVTGADVAVTAIGLGNDIDGAVSAAPFFSPNQTSRNLLHKSHLTCFFLEYPHVSISLSYT